MPCNVLIIIPCLNEESTIEKLALQLKRNAEGMNARIVIVDGGSSDRTAAIAQRLAQAHPDILYLHNPGRIQAAAVNLAVREQADGAEFFIRIDAHADYPDDYCADLLAEARARGADAVVVAMDTQGKSGFQKAVAAAQNSRLGNGGSAHRSVPAEGRWVDHGHHALMRVEAFTKAGGYDESFSHNEDAELDARLTKAGYKIWLTANTRLVYYPRTSPVALFMQYMQYGRGRLRNMLKHRTRPRLRQMLPAAVAPAAALALLSPVCGMFALPFFGWVALCLAYGARLAHKSGNPGLAVSGFAAMIMHFSWSLGFWLGVKEYMLCNPAEAA
jgi:succinoglycan biosynthesis protein ExoA